ncbi:MAG: FkbM family methyltransferase [Candidatus Methanoperedens sp.]|nr:FkbM family methyltransferase [Candidatus Methanoperedens sp.]
MFQQNEASLDRARRFTDRIKKIIEKQLDKLLKFKSFQDYINNRYKLKGYTIINELFLENIYYYCNDIAFNIDNQLESINQVVKDYDFSDIKETDIVLDIGANIGAFTMFASKKAKHVFAVEPLYANTLNKNLLKNNIINVTVLDIGLGKGDLNITYSTRNKTVKCYSLSEIIQLCGGHIDFLKMDCEGGEWTIRSDELKGIRRIEAEIHNFDKKHNFEKFMNMLDYSGFSYKIKQLSEDLILIHAKQKQCIESPKISFIILNWNGLEDTIECLNSVYQITYTNFDVVIVDNGSVDNSVEKIKEWVNINSKISIYIIENDKNYGFAEGNNIGIKYALESLDPDYVLLLNNDTIVDKDFLTTLIKTAKNDEKIGIIGPIVYSYIENIPHVDGGMDLFGYAWIKNYHVKKDIKPIIEAPHIWGACMLVKIDLIKKIYPFFDASYFLYNEETDACWRTRLAGYKVIVDANSFIYHKGGATSKKHNIKSYYFIERNRIITIIHNYETRTIILLSPLLIVNEILRILVLSPSKKIAKINGWLWIIKNREHILSTRKKIQRNRILTDKEILSQYLIGCYDIPISFNKIIKYYCKICNIV